MKNDPALLLKKHASAALSLGRQHPQMPLCPPTTRGRHGAWAPDYGSWNPSRERGAVARAAPGDRPTRSRSAQKHPPHPGERPRLEQAQGACNSYLQGGVMLPLDKRENRDPETQVLLNGSSWELGHRQDLAPSRKDVHPKLRAPDTPVCLGWRVPRIGDLQF